MFRIIVILVGVVAGCSSLAGASEKESFKPLPEPQGIWATLIGGQIADRTKFPATVLQRAEGGMCSATIIGPRVLISAAHCSDMGETVHFSVHTGESYSAKCSHHPDYKDNETADWNLCLIDREVKGITYETLSMDRTIPKKGSRVMLTGYGCTDEGGQGGIDGELRWGMVTVTRTPKRGDWDIITKGDVALCYGDSGSSAFYVGAEGDNRWMISVNSRGNIKDTSYLSKTLQNDVFSGWLKGWAASNSVQVCGLSSLPSCRSNSRAVPPKPEPGKPTDPGAPWWIWALILVGGGLGAWGFGWAKGKLGGFFNWGG